jgi:tetratricopeptide (TPR) repeat protein
MPNVSIRKKDDYGFYGHSTINHDYNLKTIKGNKVVVDNVTGLMWHQSGPDDDLKWDESKEWVEDLNSEGYAGYQDWRLPTVDEAASLLESSEKNGNLYIDPVFSKKQNWIWTGDKFGSEAAWCVDFSSGKVNNDGFGFFKFGCVRPVRSDLSKDSGEELEEEDYDTIESYKQAIRIDPDDANAHNNLGVTYCNLVMYEEAIESYKQALRINPDFKEAHNNLGIAYRDSGKHKEAIESFKQVIRIDPDDALAHYTLGLAYNISNDRGSALDQYKILKKLDTELANKLFNEIYE